MKERPVKAYDPAKIESKWQKEWEKKKLYVAKDNSKAPKFFSLIEFPFPSGEGLHVGHIRSNTAMDIISRKRRMEGYNVLYPIGWDAFGLPTENYAIKTGLHPRIVTKRNTDTFRKQLKALGYSFDWSREINTTDPGYYRWTQWIFLQLLKKGLAYKKKMFINWCPKDKIGLANEEVIDGKCERCGTTVEQREKEQWMLAITKYADRLDKDLDQVNFLEKIKLQQRNWIGKSEGAELEFALKGVTHKIRVFTTRIDTLFGVTYLVIAPEHALVQELKAKISNWNEVESYIKGIKSKSEQDRTADTKEKTGVQLKGITAINPANNREVPVFIADYVLASYGTGAVMAVPGHDDRDFEFAQKYNLPIEYVVAEHIIEKDTPVQEGKRNVPRTAVNCYIRNPKDNTYAFLEWKKVHWKGPVTGGVEQGEDFVQAALREIKEETGYKNVKFIRELGSPLRVDFYHPAKDENRFATFIGMLFELENEERDAVGEEETALHELKWIKEDKVLSYINKGMRFFERIMDGQNKAFTDYGILVNSEQFNNLTSSEAKRKIGEKYGELKVTYKLRDWIFSRQRYWGEPIPVVHCAKCGIVPVPEKELPVKLPNVKNYTPTDTGESPLAAMTKWVNTKCPQCKGKAERETDTMPNWAGSSWYYLRYVDPKNKKTFADKKKLEYWTPVDWYNGGMEHTTLHLLYSRFWHKFLYDLGYAPTSEPYQKRTSHGLILAEGGEKMSKSKGNVVNPDQIVKLYGADSLRLYEMFMGPFDQAISWSTDNIIGVRRFLDRVWRLQEKVAKKKGESSKEIESALHKTIKKVGEDIEGMRFNTCISSLMILLNDLEKQQEIPREVYLQLLILLSPFAPHITEELWSILGNKKSIHTEVWPTFDLKKIAETSVTLAVQVNGKVRAELPIGPEATEDEVKQLALTHESITKWIEGKEVKKVIYVKGKLINIVVS